MKLEPKVRIQREWRDYLGGYVFCLEHLVLRFAYSFIPRRISVWEQKSAWSADYGLACRWAKHYGIEVPSEGDE